MKQTMRKVLLLMCCLAIALALAVVTASAAETTAAEETAAVEAAEETRTGWVQEGEDWYYYDADGSRHEGWLELDGDRYYLGPERYAYNAYAIPDEETQTEKWYFFLEDGKLYCPGEGYYPQTFKDGDDYDVGYIYVYDDGTLATGWLEKDGKTRYLTPFALRGDAYEIPDGKGGSHWYCFHYDGTLHTNGWYEDSHWDDDRQVSCKDRCYSDPDGVLLTGWQLIEQRWYYLTPWACVDGIYDIPNKDGSTTAYFFDKYGKLSTGGWESVKLWDKEAKEPYWIWSYTNQDGTVRTGWVLDGGKWYYLNPWMYDEGLYQIGKEAYAFEKGGAMLDIPKGWSRVPVRQENGATITYWAYGAGDGGMRLGWLYDNGKWYYLTPWRYEGGVYEIDGKSYYFDYNGIMFDAKKGWAKWVSDDGYTARWYYGTGGGAVYVGWLTQGNVTYYLNPWMCENGICTIADETTGEKQSYFFRIGGYMAKNGWCCRTDERTGEKTWYYANSDGTLRTGWLTDGGKTYYLAPGMYANGVREIDGKSYLFNAGGALLSGEGWFSVPAGDDVYWYYGNSDGSVRTGWLELDGKWYYLDPRRLSNGCHNIDRLHYIFDEDGVMISGDGWTTYERKMPNGTTHTERYYLVHDVAQIGVNTIDGKEYCLEPAMVTGLHYDAILGYRYYDKNGVRDTTPGWKSYQKVYPNGYTETLWCYLDQNGRVYKGELTQGGKTYYLDPVMCRGCARRPSAEYFHDKNGVRDTTRGWKSLVEADPETGELRTNWYYVGSDGKLFFGWLKDGGRWYYMNETMVAGCCCRIDDTLYFFEKSGALANTAGWKSVTVQEAGKTVYKWYYTRTDGVARTGWVKDGGNWYYMDEEGVMLYSTTRMINGVWYTFNGSGVWVS